LQPYRGKPAVRNDRGDRGNVGIIEARSAPRSYPTGRSCANSGHYKPLCACVDRTFVNQIRRASVQKKFELQTLTPPAAPIQFSHFSPFLVGFATGHV
jgi:hypothetical protein